MPMPIKLVKNIRPEFTDERGDITKIIDDGKTVLKSVLIITSKKGSIRANHYHKKDTHYVYLLSGKMEYTEQPVSGPNKKESVIVEAGDLVYTPAGVAHAMRFLEDSVFVAISTEWRSRDAYESDLVRVKIV